MWDLVLRGGRVVDPGQGGHGLDATADLAVHRGLVARVGDDVGPARREVDVRGLLVLPGLVDAHTHLGGGYWGLDPDALAWRTGVTTWVDAGSAGAFTLAGHRRVTDRYDVRTALLLNVSGVGLAGETGEHHRIENLDLDAAHDVAVANGDVVVGVKARIDRHTVGPHGLEPLRRAVALARALERPLMVHIGYGPPDFADVAALLSPGDVVTHCASGVVSGVVEGGRLTAAARDAVASGVVLDLGHGSGAFAFDVWEAELEAGVRPLVSTDLHARSVHGPAFDLPSVMTKLLATGLTLGEVVAGATHRPAAALGLADGTGTLRVGAVADVAVFDLADDEHAVVDVHGGTRQARQRLVNRLTLRAGRPLPPRAAAPPEPWVPLSPAQERAEAARVSDLRRAAEPRLTSADDFDEQFPRPGGETC